MSDPIILRLNDPDAIKDNDVLNNLDNTKQLDPDKTTISSGSASMTENQLYDQLHLNYAKTLKSFIDDLLKYDLAVDGEVEVSGELDVNPSYLPDQNQPGNNDSGGTTDNKIVQNISQTIATFSDRPNVDLYDFNGNLISHKILGTNTDWQSDEEMSLNDINYYRVSEDEWVKASDVYVYVEDHTKVRTYKDSKAQLKNAHMDNTRTLDPSTDWKVDRYVMINGEKYYRVAVNEFVKASDID